MAIQYTFSGGTVFPRLVCIVPYRHGACQPVSAEFPRRSGILGDLSPVVTAPVPEGGLHPASLSYPAIALFSCPHPPPPFPSGEGGDFRFILPGLSPPAPLHLRRGGTACRAVGGAGRECAPRLLRCRKRPEPCTNAPCPKAKFRKVLGGLGASFKKPPTAPRFLTSSPAEYPPTPRRRRQSGRRHGRQGRGGSGSPR